MTADDLLAALDLPAIAAVAQRVPKRLLVENGAPTAADKRRINEGVDEVAWVAALKPTTIGVPEYRDTVREYLEIAVLRMTLHATAKPGRLVELVHRAIPYPLLLVTVQAGAVRVSAAHKRWSEGEAGKTVLDGEVTEAIIEFPEANLDEEFGRALAVGRQPRQSMFTVYQGYMDLLRAANAAQITGQLVLPRSREESAAFQIALNDYGRLEAEVVRVRALAATESQMARQVELNLELVRIERERDRLRDKLRLPVEEEQQG